MEIRLVEEKDIPNLQKMIVKVMAASLKGFYPDSWINYSISRQTIARLMEKAKTLHFYILLEGDEIYACGAIGGDYYGNTNEACLFSIYVDPSQQGKGYGRKIMQTLENDEYFRRAKRIECPSSLNAVPFYLKMGYKHKNGELICQNGEISLEKFNNMTL